MITTLELFLFQAILTTLMAIITWYDRTNWPLLCLFLLVNILIPIMGAEAHLVYACIYFIGIPIIVLLQNSTDGNPDQDIPWDSYF